MSYFYIFLTIVFTVYGQIAIKWQVLKAGMLPDHCWENELSGIRHHAQGRTPDEETAQ